MSVVSEQDVVTYLGLSAINQQAQLAWQQAEQHVKDFLGWQEIEQQNLYEYFVLTQPNYASVNDPTYIKSSSGKNATPGWYLSPNRIQLRSIPVRAILNAWEDITGFFGQYFGQSTPGTTFGFQSASQLTVGKDCFLIEEMPAPYGGLPISWSGLLERYGWWFPAAAGSVLVEYTAGFSQNELNGRWSIFKTAVLEEAADLYLRQKAVGGGQFAGISSEGLGGGASTTYTNNHQYGECIVDSAVDKIYMYRHLGEHAL